eukprot:196368-Lingulodinium_polyedra.AAC.1
MKADLSLMHGPRGASKAKQARKGPHYAPSGGRRASQAQERSGPCKRRHGAEACLTGRPLLRLAL